jgi:hypothetical protein
MIEWSHMGMGKGDAKRIERRRSGAGSVLLPAAFFSPAT